jgi:hypothetical protein
MLTFSSALTPGDNTHHALFRPEKRKAAKLDIAIGVIVIAFSLVQVYRCWKFIIRRIINERRASARRKPDN